MAEFKRKIYGRLLDWKEQEEGRTALLIEGARRVGKTTIVSLFARNEYRSHLLIDFSTADKTVIDVFENHSDDLDDFFFRLEFATKVKLHERGSLIIFDEVQLYPKARQMIKHLVSDRRYDYIETGSLISVKENVKGILIPSEERIIRMYPMDFEEFLWALGDDVSMEHVRTCFIKRESLGREMHKRMMGSFRKYMVIGGMPQVVERYLEDNSLQRIERVKRDIIDLYRKDIMKLPSNLSSRALRLFDSVPSILSSKKKIIRPAKIQKGTRMRDYDRAAVWLSEAMMINLCSCQTDPSVTSGLDVNDSRVKPYLLDTGLLISLAFGKDRELMEQTYESLLNGRLSVNEGMFFENVVAQEFRATGHQLLFIEFNIKESTSTYEVDFLLPKLNKVSPVDVKSSSSSKHTSMDVFCSKYRRRVERPVIIHSKDLMVDGDILYVPVYMTMLL